MSTFNITSNIDRVFLKNIKFEKADEAYWVSNAKVYSKLCDGDDKPLFELVDLNSRYLYKKDRKKGVEVRYIGECMTTCATYREAVEYVKNMSVSPTVIELYTLSEYDINDAVNVSEEYLKARCRFYVVLDTDGMNLTGEFHKLKEVRSYYPHRIQTFQGHVSEYNY